MRLNYIKMCSVYKRSTWSRSIGFLFGCNNIVIVICIILSNKELQRTSETISLSVKSVQDDIVMLKCGAIYIQWHRPAAVRISGTQSSSIARPCWPNSPSQQEDQKTLWQGGRRYWHHTRATCWDFRDGCCVLGSFIQYETGQNYLENEG